MAAATSGSIAKGMVWMFVLSILLFWMPVLGPLIAGFVGGRKSGSIGNAILAALLPGLIIGGAAFFFASMLTLNPLFGFLAGLGGAGLALAHVGPMLVAAIVGAAI
jgi:hypothetical protein